MTTFGTAIASWRSQRALTQRDLAYAAGVSAQYINDIEHDRRKPPPGLVLCRLADALGLPVEYLMVLAGRLPDDVTVTRRGPWDVKAAIDELREMLK